MPVNLRPILMVVGTLLCVLATAMIIPGVVDYISGDSNWTAFAISAFFTFFAGVGLFVTNQGFGADLTIKQTFLMTTLAWVVLVVFAALPLMFSDQGHSYTDAFFESMSGLTTTGATVFTGLDELPKGTLLWRAILQWLGGIGIIVMAMSLLPLLKIGGMQLLRSESSDNADKILPKATQLAGAITSIYALFTLITMFALYLAGMPAFEALCHAMTSVSTAGFSTHDMSIAFYDNYSIEIIMTIAMLMGGIPFVLYVQLMRGKPLSLIRDSQVHWYLTIVVFSVLMAWMWLRYGMHLPAGLAFREASFNVVSVITTTGYSTIDYNLWGYFPIAALFLLTVVGGCTGSTTGGIKIFRFQVLFATAKTQINRLVHPHGVFRPMYNGKPVSDDAMNSVMSFVILFGLLFSSLAVLLSLTGLDFLSAMSASASMMANLGPGLGDKIGPAGNYSEISDLAKWICTFGMLIGRLEIFTVLVLLSPKFWKN